MSKILVKKALDRKAAGRTAIPGGHFVSVTAQGRSTSVAYVNFQSLPAPPNPQYNDINRFKTLLYFPDI